MQNFPDFLPGQNSVPSTKVEISISCRNLLDKDILSKSDPLCVMFNKNPTSEEYYEYDRTETIQDNLNPHFVKRFVIDYHFEELQKLKFELYDIDSAKHHLSHHDFLGRMECSLGEIVGASSGHLEKPLTGGGKRNCGHILLRAEELSDCKKVAAMKIKGINLDKKDFFGKSDPFLLFHRCNGDGSYTVCYKSEYIKNTLNPSWKTFTVSLKAICNGDIKRPLKIECLDWNRNGSVDMIGEFSTTMQRLMEGPGSTNTYQLINKKKTKKGNSGAIVLESIHVEDEHSFLDYIKAGMDMAFTVAIDFTASNGHPTDPKSLHYMAGHHPNPYVQAIQSVGDIIQDYDSDKMFPVLGFGARLPPDGKLSHEFPLNGSASDPHCHGVSGILDAYKQTLAQVQLYGPTNFSPVIYHVANFARNYINGAHYFVLLIITDGVITDMEKTKEAIVFCSSLPMSIIIVGVGEADFTNMETLDGDDVRVSYQGRFAERDIVQFVPFRKFVGGLFGSSIEHTKAYLAKEVLAEIPDQIVGFMKSRKLTPDRIPQQNHQSFVGSYPVSLDSFSRRPPASDVQMSNQRDQTPVHSLPEGSRFSQGRQSPRRESLNDPQHIAPPPYTPY